MQLIKVQAKNIKQNEKNFKNRCFNFLCREKFQNTGQSFLKAIQLALHDIGNKNITIYPKR